MVTLAERIAGHGDRLAIVDPFGAWTFAQVDARADQLTDELLADDVDLAGARVAVVAEPGHRFVSAALGVWRAGGMLLPLLPSHPEPELRYLLDDAAASVIVTTPTYRTLATAVADGRRVVVTSEFGATPLGTLGTRMAPNRCRARR